MANYCIVKTGVTNSSVCKPHAEAKFKIWFVSSSVERFVGMSLIPRVQRRTGCFAQHFRHTPESKYQHFTPWDQDSHSTNDKVMLWKKEPPKKTEVIKLLLYIQIEQDIQICLTTSTEHALHPAAY